ncbi:MULTISPECIES: TniB family NTP-binding protein [Deefgea]|uniref:AAA family ATPase n=1 Tax=Deefgea chitinilytica TaxID=570276 RepID=A0ABS2CG39_9NEIS|nr:MULTISPECIES: TniB family NTP-binding protein [Deefgea]MBM5573007.1 AAA family ATPase [Deefgea chitinilytica]MBM9890243.1 TniB family NTP-binding protein [Deefgea sp. CFH1-16]
MIEQDANDDPDMDSRIFELEKTIWFNYPLAEALLEHLDSLIKHPPSHRMPNMALIGDSNNGKSALLKRFASKHNPPDLIDDQRIRLPVLVMQCPSNLSEGRLYGELLKRLFAEGSIRESAESMFNRLSTLVRQLSIQMIVLDEFHNALTRPQKMRECINTVKYMCNEFCIPFVLSGTPEMLSVLQSDAQLSNRFPPRDLPKWPLDDDFRRMIHTVEDSMKLKESSGLHRKTFAQKIHIESGGLLGEVIDLLHLLGVQAIKSGTEQITLEMLDREYLKNLGWSSPSLRGMQTSGF